MDSFWDFFTIYTLINRMIIPGSTYWNFGVGRDKDDVADDRRIGRYVAGRVDLRGPILEPDYHLPAGSAGATGLEKRQTRTSFVLFLTVAAT